MVERSMEHDGLETIISRLEVQVEEKIELLKTAHLEALQTKLDALEESQRRELELLKDRGCREAEIFMEKGMAEGKADSDRKILECKNLLLDKVFQLAMDRLCRLDDNALEKFMANLMSRVDEISDGEPYTLEHPEGADGGFIVHTTKYDLDCTYGSLMDQVREASDVEVARMLFE